MLIADRHPFNGIEDYFTDSVLYRDSLGIGPVLSSQTLEMRPMKS